jgi:hypothetical protein
VQSNQCLILPGRRPGIRKVLANKRTSRGVALIEAALAVPVILLFIGGAIDLGSLLVGYVSASKLSYEGARFAAQIPGIAVPASNLQDITFPACNDVQFISPQGQVCARIRALVPVNSAASNFLNTEPDAIKLVAEAPSKCSNLPPNVSPPVTSIEVEVALPWKPLLLSFLEIDKVRASSNAPYLKNIGALDVCNSSGSDDGDDA